MTDHDSQRTGLTAGVAAYLLWGLFPLFWPLLKPAAPLEILAHRIVWSFVVVGIALVALRASWRWVPGVFSRANLPRMAAAAGLIALNWLTYIFAVNNGFVVEGSLGYFINPLANVVFGVLIFGERLGRGGAGRLAAHPDRYDRGLGSEVRNSGPDTGGGGGAATWRTVKREGPGNMSEYVPLNLCQQR